MEINKNKNYKENLKWKWTEKKGEGGAIVVREWDDLEVGDMLSSMLG